MKSARSLPDENAPGTPRIRWTRTCGSSSAPVSAAAIAAYMSRVMAFFLSGRFMRMICTAPRRSISICWLIAISSGRQRGVGRHQAFSAVDDPPLQRRSFVDQVFGKETRQRHAGLVLACQRAAHEVSAACGKREQPQIWRRAGKGFLLPAISERALE